MAVLGITRPFEALLVSLPLTLVLLQGLAGLGDRRALLLRGILPAAVLLALTASSLAYNNWRVTGNAIQTPYLEYSEAYDPPYIFLLWKPAIPPRPHRHQLFAGMEEWLSEKHTEFRTLSGFLAEKKKLAGVSMFLLGPPIVALAFVPLAIRDRWVRIALVICGAVVVANLVIPWTYAHYFAPVTSLVFFLAVTGLREAERTLDGPVRGRLAVGRGFVVLMVLFSAVFFAKRWVQQASLEPKRFHTERRTVLEELAGHRGDQLVIVRYADGHRWPEEWVYNEADIDAAPIVWARYIDDASTRRLLSYFAGRRAWVLDVNGTATLRRLTR